ncbi:hypothetical protein ABGB18_27930 [Nonomuraea sp. B12E4]|uniref:hypothetical protein n=1 Tax=Nonomuraea sp. B12E4 TaxID=3153564 RepID=UPI00325D659F
MLVILAIAAIAILACVVLVSLGRGGELTEFPPDVPPLDLPEPGQLTAVDFMALQLPVNLVGYHTASVDETLRRAATAISARDTRIAVLEQRVSELLSSRLHARQEVHAGPGAGLRTDHEPEAPPVPRELPEAGDPVTASGTAVAWDGAAELSHPPEDPEWHVPPAGAGRPDGHQDTTEAEPAEPWDDQPGEPEDAAKPADETKPDETEPDKAKADETKADETKADETEPDEAQADGIEAGREPVEVAGARDGDGLQGEAAAAGKEGDERS